jgi:hypothetical protein
MKSTTSHKSTNSFLILYILRRYTIITSILFFYTYYTLSSTTHKQTHTDTPIKKLKLHSGSEKGARRTNCTRRVQFSKTFLTGELLANLYQDNNGNRS